MAERIKPFSNGTEFMIWESRNCDKCKRAKCYAKLQLQKGCITGEITLKQAKWIGYENGILKRYCNHFNEPNLKYKTNNILIDKFQYNIF